jgi:16S rRNA (guanine(527)-N(7))-methyltransferase RsmG
MACAKAVVLLSVILCCSLLVSVSGFYPTFEVSHHPGRTHYRNSFSYQQGRSQGLVLLLLAWIRSSHRDNNCSDGSSLIFGTTTTTTTTTITRKSVPYGHRIRGRQHLTLCFVRKPIRPRSSSQPLDTTEELPDDQTNGNDTSSSVAYTLDPTSPKAKDIIFNTLRLSSQQYDQIVMLSQLIVQWNDSVNLISRKDCTVGVVFGRHILPSLALLNLPNSPMLPSSGNDDDAGDREVTKQIIDVGTGGGFPGLPLAIAYPQHQFLLVDSTGKKLQVVKAIADELGLTNVKTYHGRVEEMMYLTEEGGTDSHTDESAMGNRSRHKRRYHVCLGRSVAPLPKFCSWIHELLRKEDGHLVYIIGGEIEEWISDKVQVDVPLQNLIPLQDDNNNVGSTHWSEKRALVFSESSVANIGEPLRKKSSIKNNIMIPPPSSSSRVGSKPKPRAFEETIKPAKGQWKKKDRSIPRQRGYENFKRFDTSIDGK